MFNASCTQVVYDSVFCDDDASGPASASKRVPGFAGDGHDAIIYRWMRRRFKGARPYHQAYDRGVKLIGATAHYVTSDLDEGPIIEQSVQPVDHAYTPEQLVAVAVMVSVARMGLWEPIVGCGYVRNYLNSIGYAVTWSGLAGLIYLAIKEDRAEFLKAAIANLVGLGMLAPMLMATFSPPVSFPPIHDVTTDTANPPQFLVLDDNRPGACNSLVDGGEEIAAQQLAAFPDIAPIQSDLSPTEAFAKSLEIAKIMGWEIVVKDSDALRNGATARTPVYRFVDDVVVTVTPVGETSRIDIRSVSRIGRGDRGVDAARIRAFTGAFQ